MFEGQREEEEERAERFEGVAMDVEVKSVWGCDCERGSEEREKEGCGHTCACACVSQCLWWW